jgi:Tfp pilus assembly protein PilX
MMNNRTQTESGFTVLIAVVIGSIMMILALYMATIARKEIVLSSLGRDSQYAFYAADAGAECALYWDFQNAFSPAAATHNAYCWNTKPVGRYDTAYSSAPTDLVIGGVNTTTGTAVSRMQFEYNGRCVIVTVTKTGTVGNEATAIDSRGYSTPCTQLESPRRLERTVQLSY